MTVYRLLTELLDAIVVDYKGLRLPPEAEAHIVIWHGKQQTCAACCRIISIEVNDDTVLIHTEAEPAPPLAEVVR